MSLLAMQRDFRAWLAEESEDAALRLGAGLRPGLSVYLNNYRAQLLACLSESFEKVRQWLGEERFLSVAAAHVDLTPPQSWTLDAYAEGFPDSLVRLFPDDPEVAEIASLELALAQAFVGEDAAALDPSTLGSVDWDNARIGIAPTVALLPVTTNAAPTWSALAAGEMPPPAERLAGTATVLVWRREQISCFRMAEPGEGEAIAQARGGASFAAICSAMTAMMGEEEGIAAAGTLLGRWIAEGIAVSID